VLSSHYVAASERLRQSEVEHFTGAIGAELDVRGFEITVDNALLVRGLEAAAICVAIGGASSTRIGACSIRFGRRETVNEFRQL